jgi:hypothetical protein
VKRELESISVGPRQYARSATAASRCSPRRFSYTTGILTCFEGRPEARGGRSGIDDDPVELAVVADDVKKAGRVLE